GGLPVERNGRKFRILIADGQVLFRRGLVTLLAGEHDLGTISEVATYEEAVELARSLAPDVIVVEAGLLSGSVQAKLDALKQLEQPAAVLVLASDGDSQRAEEA